MGTKGRRTDILDSSARAERLIQPRIYFTQAEIEHAVSHHRTNEHSALLREYNVDVFLDNKIKSFYRLGRRQEQAIKLGNGDHLLITRNNCLRYYLRSEGLSLLPLRSQTGQLFWHELLPSPEVEQIVIREMNARRRDKTPYANDTKQRMMLKDEVRILVNHFTWFRQED